MRNLAEYPITIQEALEAVERAARESAVAPQGIGSIHTAALQDAAKRLRLIYTAHQTPVRPRSTDPMYNLSRDDIRDMVGCPVCDVKPGEVCIYRFGNGEVHPRQNKSNHHERMQLAQRTARARAPFEPAPKLLDDD